MALQLEAELHDGVAYDAEDVLNTLRLQCLRQHVAAPWAPLRLARTR
eukprot:CAMPEP_0195125868 /NCGR_PEP_ID=MMETSP0448-20130528/133821_1 /TAXON_ID=66468 /ORGANISM="Heterocapsa triquestra, Strain CCMP 448" /LENGTH=46 /DNA_ID= /DNA_START= /DNA_END= /DNA_ORIENTATION=